MLRMGFPGGIVVKNQPANARGIRDTGLIPGSEQFLGGGHGNPLQYTCLENPMDRGTWQATVHSVIRSWTQPKWLSMHAKNMFSCVRNCQTVFPSSCNICIPTSNEWEFLLATSSPVFGVVSVAGLGHSNKCTLISHCYFNFHFPEDICGASLHTLICHFCTFFSEVSLKVSDPVFNWLVVYLVWVLRVLCIFWITVVFFCYIFVHAKYIFFEIP